MFTLSIGGTEAYNEQTQKFETVGGTVLRLEHSLVSVSKWEAEFKRPFLSTDDKTPEETLGYIRHMVLNEDWDPSILELLEEKHVQTINDYLSDKLTATWFTDQRPGPSREIITSELVYYWMTVANIPLEAERWPLARLFTLIRVVNEKNKPPKKMRTQEAAAKQRELNRQRLAANKTRG